MPLVENQLTEAQFQSTVEFIAQNHGWLCYHTRDSRRSNPGFPDLVLVKAGRSVIFAELKTNTGKLRPEQRAWLSALNDAGASTFIWRPDDIDDIDDLLTSRPVWMRDGTPQNTAMKQKLLDEIS